MIIIFDFDGTLSPIVPERSRAELHPECENMLQNLVKSPKRHVAVLSSRTLDDLADRLPVAGLFLGGSSGTDWQVPGGHRMFLAGRAADKLRAVRNRGLQGLLALAAIPGIEVEDKKWSVALHTRNASPAGKEELSVRLAAWRNDFSARMYLGPEVCEIQWLPQINKSFGVRYLLKFLKHVPSSGTIIYAGDDQNDATAMRLVTRLGGTAITVGDRPLIPSSRIVPDQKYLAAEICNLLSL